MTKVGPSQSEDEAQPPEHARLRVSSEHADAAGQRRSRSADQMVRDLRTMGDELLADMRLIDPAEASAPSLCPGWSVRDVVLHFVVGDDRAWSVLNGEDPFPDPTSDEATLMAQSNAWVEEQGDVPMDEAIERFAAARDRMLRSVGEISDGEWGEYVPWGAQPITRFSLIQSRLMETWVHGWDARWPVDIVQPVDDRTWWVADMAVRHVPYALMKSRVPVPDALLDVSLSGPAGGTWTRGLGAARSAAGADTDRITIKGPAWAWVAWASQRAPGRESESWLEVAGPQVDDIMRVARCFA